MNRKIKKPESPFKRGFKNASVLSAGTLLSQVIGFVGFLFIVRLFGPEQYGIYATVLAFVMFFHIFAFNGLSKIIVREGSKNPEGFSGVLEKTLGLRLAFILLALLICIGASFFTGYPRGTKVLIIIFSTEIIYFGLDSFLGSVYQTFEKMQYLAYFSLLMRFLTAALSIAFLAAGAGVAVILAVNLIVKFLVLSLNYFWSRTLIRFRLKPRLILDRAILKSTVVFSLMGFVNTLAVKIDVLMVTFLSGARDVGLYSAAHELGREGLIFRNIMAVAFFPIAVKFFKEGKLRVKTLFLYASGLFAVALAGCLAVSFFSVDLVVLFFKKDYFLSGRILRILIFYLPFTFFSLPLSTCLQATHNENILLAVYCLTAAANIPLNLILYYRFGLIGIAYSTLAVFFLESLLISLLAVWRMKKQGHLV